MSAKSTIAIVGSGFGGFTLAHELSLAKYDVVVISPMRTIQYTPLLASAAAGMFNFRLAEDPVRRRNRLPGLQYYKASVCDIDFSGKTLRCTPAVPDIADNELSGDKHAFTVTYDTLVLAPGCTVETFGTPGADEHAIFLRTTDDARRVQKRLLEMVDAASLPGLTPAQQRDMLRVIVVGGGAIGIEATAELYDLWHHDLRFLYPHLDVEGENGLLAIEVHDVAPGILGNFDSRLAEYALQKLQRRGVRVETGSHITRLEDGAMYTKERGGDNNPLRYGMLIWATGNGVNPLVGKLDVKKAGRMQRIVTDRKLRVQQSTPPQGGGGDDAVMPDVYALGDCADIEGYSLPMLAEVAVQQAKYLAKQLNARGERGEQADEGFTYQQRPNLAYLGEHDGVAAGDDVRNA
ncbi:uncharacterized protein B0I36DRAFT_392593 [Microdochium trichocladiopsis]|uniref:FAD/NAD(P)-binding domain-containing protein n=1 Tax=Microdochium trichocladiopsis TaxID=1682393 RepID=A0A9P8YKB4_9PEZI|nr:uncharacterized protein B0I36DRAFT_392593 [Microdochium trichocladiopsis]KAH7041527.1 hypothetical protein B0I36DRAFT_392593 [Microdochium trichocladiopsis]